MSNTVISDNRALAVGGGGILIATSDPNSTRCTIAGNHAGANGGALATYSEDPMLDRCILWGNCADQVSDEVHLDAGSSATLLCSLVSIAGIEGPGSLNLDGNTIDEDPIFCAPAACTEAPTTEGTYTIDASSPTVAENSPVCGLIGALDVDCRTSI